MQKTRKLFRHSPSNTVFLECDIQEKFRTLMQNGPSVVHNARRLALTAKLFKIPIVSSQQLPKVFGETVKEVAEAYDSYPEGVFRFNKTDFSMLEKPIWDKL